MNRIKFTARWPGAIEGRAVNLVKRHFSRLCAEHEFDDLMQEAYLVFMRVKARYPQCDRPEWFMSLFQVSLTNHLLNLGAKCGRTVSLEELPLGDLPEMLVQDEGFRRMVLQQLPVRMKHLLRLVCFPPDAATGQRAFVRLMEFAVQTH